MIAITSPRRYRCAAHAEGRGGVQVLQAYAARLDRLPRQRTPLVPQGAANAEPDGPHAGSALGFSCQLNCGAVRKTGEVWAKPDTGLAGAEDQRYAEAVLPAHRIAGLLAGDSLGAAGSQNARTGKGQRP